MQVNNMKVLTRFSLALFILTLQLPAQVNTGAVSGYLLDPSSKAIPNAPVSIEDTARSLTRSGRTNSSGFYEFDGLPPAEYRVSANADSFAPLQTEPIRVEVDQQLRLDLHPTIAVKGERVVVQGATPDLSSDSGELGAVFDQNLVSGLPLNERDFLQLALLLPGVGPPVAGSQLSTRGTFAMHANGGREEANNFLLDGVDNNDSDTRGYVLQPSVDAIQEFKIATNSYSAEYGNAGAGQVNIITRGGGNQFNGTVYDYLRNRDLDARNFFDGSTKPQYIRNQFGAGLGGPIVRNSTFFFLNYEGLRNVEGETQLGTVPTDAVRGGNLSSLGVPAFNPFTGVPFTGGIIPKSLISSNAAQVLALFPEPNLPGNSGNYLSNPVGTNNQNEGSARIDHRISDNARITARYTYGRRDLFEPFAENQTELPGFGDFVFDRGHNALLSYQQTFGPRTINSVTAGFNRAVRQVFPQNYTVNVNQQWGVSYLPTVPRDFGYPGISVTGFSRVGDVASLPIDRADNTYQIGDNLTLNRGAHSIKIGGEFRALELNGYVEVYSRGQINFTGALTGSGIGDLLFGLPTLGIHSTYTGPQTLRSKSINAYVQDDWKITRNLTVNLGFRYEYDSPATDPTNRMATFDFQTGSTVQVGTNGISRSGTQGWNGGFDPRVGFAWSPMNKTVIRGGYGIYHDAGMFVVDSSLYYNPPYFTVSVFFPSATSLITLANPFATSNGFVPPAALSILSPNFKPSYTQHWNLNIQREIDRVGVFTIAYAASKGTDLPRSLDINQPFPGSAPLYTRAPYPAFSNILETESGGNSEYQSLQLSLKRQLSGRLSVVAAYTFSKSIDDTSAFLPTSSDQNFPQDSHNYRLERSLSSFDVPHRGTIAFLYRIPGASPWIRGFELSSIITAQSGLPFTPELSSDNSNTGNTGGNFGIDRPNVLHNPTLSNPTPSEWFDVTAFAIPPQFTWGNAGRNILRGPGLFTTDLSLRRVFALRERLRLTAEAQSFNLFNQANFNQPDAFADQPLTFGKIFSAKDPRQIQFALRLAF
jgi:Carboxypeptidase regulatory-like domain/TonB dependent receptor